MKKSGKRSSKKNEKFDDPLKGDLSELLLQADWQMAHFERRPKNKTITLRISEELLKAVKQEAAKEGLDYQKFIRLALEKLVLKAS